MYCVNIHGTACPNFVATLYDLLLHFRHDLFNPITPKNKLYYLLLKIQLDGMEKSLQNYVENSLYPQMKFLIAEIRLEAKKSPLFPD